MLELPARPGERLAFTTDSYVVSPLFFPGGDIGKLAVHGTINDLAMAGARPRWLSLGFILEEGLPLAILRRVVASIAQAVQVCGVHIVTGDTKVVGHGQADQLFTTPRRSRLATSSAISDALSGSPVPHQSC